MWWYKIIKSEDMKQKRKSKKKNTGFKSYNKTIVLSNEDIIRDYSHLAKLRVSENRRDWIETTMYTLRSKANIYERKLIDLFTANKVVFIHQAPFILDGKIYFADFFLPDENIIVEIDGDYHSGISQKSYDKDRDRAFKSYNMKTIRISNELVKEATKLKQILSLLKS